MAVDHATPHSGQPVNAEPTGDKRDNDGADTKSSSSGTGDGDTEKKKGEEAAPPPGTPVERSRLKIAIIMLALGLAVFLAAIDITIITTALPTISEVFKSSAGYTWIGAAYLLANAGSTPIWGKISDVFGRKPVLLVANFVFFIGSLVAALANSIGMLIAGRAVQGIGGGGLIVLVNITVSDLFSPRKRGAYFGVIGGVWAIASSIGPLLGGAFTQKVSWRWCFYINLPLDGLAFFIILFFLDVKTPRTPLIAGLKAIDWLGALLIVGGVLMFLFGLEFGGQTYPWSSATVICLLVFGVVVLVLFALSQVYLAKYPIMAPAIFSKRTNVASLGACFFQSFVFIGGSYYLPLYFQASLGATPILSGVYLLANTIAIAVFSVATGIIIRKTGRYLPLIFFGMILMTLGYGLIIDLDASSSWAKIVIFQIIAGLGTGPNFQAPLIALQSAISPKDIASATATFGFTRQLSTAISVVIGGVIFQNQLAKNARSVPQVLAGGGGGPGASIGVIDSLPAGVKQQAQQAFAKSLQPAWILYTCVGVLGVLNCFLIGRQTLSKQHVETETGLAAEERARLERLKERDEKRASRMNGRKSADVGKASGEMNPRSRGDENV